MPVFSADVVAAVLHHMNDDHRDDNVLIARAFGNAAAASATMTDLDENGGRWSYVADSVTHDLEVPWSTAISERAEIRREIVVLYDSACERLGLEPRPH
ncbi:DUF2470 domain-containing protein [Salinibacterium hongtaonis]|uniref:DUF2470 domain-containing protein n=1 Tax=Homoserinimonas hongtaonis TaxID=2079791 RepID=UPI000D361126|nr:DUF2470 domain-containing protein [Salinibacterium hongtaonis]AWB90399.1 hypothetical protein C2138_13305 [Salinibacterium hongtaonis]